MLETQNENVEVISDSTTYAVKILNEVRDSYSTFAKRDFGVYDDSILESSENSSLESSNDSLVENTVSNISEPDNSDIPESNCLALVVRKDYNLTIVKNVFTTTGRLSWKIALITAIINVLNMLF